MAGPVHFEVFARRTAQSGWALQQATESREQAMQLAEDLLSDKRAVSVRVTKETLDVETMEFMSVTLLTKGAPEAAKPKQVRDDRQMNACAAPPDLYTPLARELIGRVLEDWLARNRVTPFELLHRPDLIEKLEASGVELQHAVQKVAVPESQASGQPVHEVIRHYQRLIEQASDRVLKFGRGGGFPDLNGQTLGDIARRLADAPERAFVMGGAVAKALAPVRGWRAKLETLMDLADTAPGEAGPSALVHVAIEQMTLEILSVREGLAEVLGPSLDLGGQLAALVRMASPAEVDALAKADPTLAEVMPPLEGPARRLGARMAQGQYKLLAASLSRRVLRELMGPRRLRPHDAAGEIDILRALAMTLTAAAGRLLTLEETQLAFAERSKALVGADFVESYLGREAPPLMEAAALVRLCENVTGASAKRSAARWLAASVTALKFERSLREPSVGVTQRLASLAELQARTRACELNDKDEAEICEALGRVGGVVEADARFTLQLARAPAPPVQKLGVLLKLAAGEGCPLGPAAERAKAEALRLLKAPETRQAIAADPQSLGALRPLIQGLGLAA
ncbi:hypothetical protein [Brevundimonas sp.]|uniref:hypothetical protein n=1 Tax=Brevundimonas sp. TaxID=1871086 RepID=UPI0025E11077|nr:hypothetical protein [Brevundimonas sp.]